MYNIIVIRGNMEIETKNNNQELPWYKNWKIVTPIGVAIVAALALIIGLSVGLTAGKGTGTKLDALHKISGREIYSEENSQFEDEINKEIESIDGLKGNVDYNTYTNLSESEIEQLENSDDYFPEEYFVKYTTELNNFEYRYENEEYSKVYKADTIYCEYYSYINESGEGASGGNYYINNLEYEYTEFERDIFYDLSLDKANLEVVYAGLNDDSVGSHSINIYFNGIESSILDDAYGFYYSYINSVGTSDLVSELEDNQEYNQNKLDDEDKIDGVSAWVWTGSHNFNYRYFAD